MPQRILIAQTDAANAESLIRLFAARGDQAWALEQPAQPVDQIEQIHPDIVVIDLHLPGNGCLDLLRLLKRRYPQVKVILTSQHPDFQRELLAREQGASVFLREPFNQRWVDQAVLRLSDPVRPVTPKKAPLPLLPRVRIPVRIKITIPYMILALIFALAGAYLVSQVVLGSIEDRFNGQLVATGKQNADWMVQEENRRLETLRLIANTQGIAGDVSSGNAEHLRGTILSLALNSGEEIVDILDRQGTSIVSLQHVPGGKADEYSTSRGDTLFTRWSFVQYVLSGKKDQGQDKDSGLVQTPAGWVFFVSGPILDAQSQLVGVVLVGRTLQALTSQMHAATLADITLYDRDGKPLASTMVGGAESVLPLTAKDAAALLAVQDQSSLSRDWTIASNQYSELLGPWEARNKDDLGIMGTALPRLFLEHTNQITRTQVFLLIAALLLLVIGVGITLANQITNPLLRIVRASSEVAKGNLDVKVDPRGNDEVAVLAHSFNSMVAGLQEGSMYRDLLGRTVSPEVREQLRQTFTSGNLRLEGQEAVATVLMSDIRGFTSLSEKSDPATIFRWLNEYFGELVPIVTANNGVVNKFDGDAMLAFFGILPRLLNPKQSAYSACKSAIEMLSAIDRLNLMRVERGDSPLSTGIGINTGMVTAGGLGTSDRMHYTIIGDTVNTTQRLETLTRQLFNVSGVLISESTYNALGEYRREFRIDPLGLYGVKGKAEQLSAYRLMPLTEMVMAVKEMEA